MYNLIFDSTNNIILNTSYLLDAHKLLMDKSKQTKKDYVAFLDNSDLQNNLLSLKSISQFD